jgi:Rieske Fe-S protein
VTAAAARFETGAGAARRSRRAFLKAVGDGAAALGVAAAAASLGGCRPAPGGGAAAAPAGPADAAAAPVGAPSGGAPAASAPATASLPVTRAPRPALAEGARAVVQVGGYPTEVRMRSGHLEARLLLCTHQGCPVTFDEAAHRYRCACHQGEFDADGAPIAGAPTVPLQRVPVRVDGDDLVLGG